jgi:hypothetical protein
MYIQFELEDCGKKNRVDLTAKQSATLTEANHVFVEGEVVINGVHTKYSIHLYRFYLPDVDPSVLSTNWKIKEPYFPYYNNPTLSYAAKQKGNQEIPELLAEALMRKSNIDKLFCEAEIKHTEDLIQRAECAIAEKERELLDLKTGLSLLQKVLENAKNGVVKKGY